MKKTRAYRRSQRERVINRKTRILRKFGGEEYIFAWSRGKRGRFAKGKIHCSCWMCRSKSYDILSHADERELLASQQQMSEEASKPSNGKLL
jgi:hypothetical protein